MDVEYVVTEHMNELCVTSAWVSPELSTMLVLLILG